jgi:hypothetical protein
MLFFKNKPKNAPAREWLVNFELTLNHAYHDQNKIEMTREKKKNTEHLGTQRGWYGVVVLCGQFGCHFCLELLNIICELAR